MYQHTIEEMVDAGVAQKLDEPQWMDRSGARCEEKYGLGFKVTHLITRPDMCICGDEVGGNISMKGDGHVGGELLLGERGTVPQKKSSTRSKKFTMIGLTVFTGEPVMCILIIEGKNLMLLLKLELIYLSHRLVYQMMMELIILFKIRDLESISQVVQPVNSKVRKCQHL